MSDSDVAINALLQDLHLGLEVLLDKEVINHELYAELNEKIPKRINTQDTELMKAQKVTAVKSVSVRRKPVSNNVSPVRRKPVSPQNANIIISPMSPKSLITIVSHDQQGEPTSTAAEGRTLGQTRESAVETSSALRNDHLSKYENDPYLSESPNGSTPQIEKTNGETLERAQTAPAQLAAVQSFIPEDINDKKRRRKKAIRNGLILYITFIS